MLIPLSTADLFLPHKTPEKLITVCVLPLPGWLQETFCWCDAGGGRWLKQHGAFWSQHQLISINEAVLNQFEAVVCRRSLQGLTFA